LVAAGANTLSTVDHKVRHGMPSKRTVASSAMTSASEEECDIAVCFLHSQVIGTNVCLPTRHNKPPDVDLLVFKSPANPASANSTVLQSTKLSPTKQVCDQCFVKCM